MTSENSIFHQNRLIFLLFDVFLKN